MIAAATSAYDTAYLVTMIVLAVMLASGAALTNRLLRAYGRGSEAMGTPKTTEPIGGAHDGA